MDRDQFRTAAHATVDDSKSFTRSNMAMLKLIMNSY